MASKNETTTKFRVDITELKKGIQEANRQIKLANAEFKAASSGMENWGKSADGVQKKIDQLDKVLDGQKKILENYQKQLAAISKEYGENSKEADEMRIKIYNQQSVINNTNAELQKYKGILSDLKNEQEKAADSTEKQAKAYDDLESSVRDQQSRLDDLKDKYKQVVVEQGKNSDSAQELAREIEELSTELKDNKKAMQDADKSADDLDHSLDDAGKSAKDADDGFTILKGTLSDLASKAISAVIDGLKNMAKAAGEAWKEFDEGRDTVIKLTGATGDAAAELTKSFGNVSKSIVADSSEIANAIGEVNTRFGLSGDSLEDLATQYVKFSKITDADIISTIDDTQKALSAYGKGVEDAEGFLDSLAKTSQNTGVNVSTLTKGIISNATAFQEMDLTIDQAVTFMGQLEKSGANAETVMSGMRKALKNSANDGLSLDEALLKLQNEIENGTNGMDGLNAAYELFGKSGDQIYGSIKNGTLSFKDLTKSVEDTSGTVSKTYEQTLDATDDIKLEIQKLKVAAAEFLDDFLKKHEKDIKRFFNTAIKGLEKLFPFVEKLAVILPKLLPVLVGIGTAFMAFKVVGIITALISAFQNLFAIIKTGQGVMAALNVIMGANPVGLIIAAIAGLVAAFAVLWNTSEDFRNFWIGLWEGIKTFVGDSIKGIVLFFQDLWKGMKETAAAIPKWVEDHLINPVTKLFTDMWNGIKAKAEEIWNGIKAIWAVVSSWFETTIINPVKDYFTGMWDNLKMGASEAWEGIKSVFKPVADWFGNTFRAAWERVKAVFSTGGKIFDGIKEGIIGAFKTVVNGIIGGINKVIAIPFKGINDALDTIRELSVAGVKPFANMLPRLTVPEIPLLAQGGVLRRGQMGLLEGSGAEAVVPLDQNKRWIAATAEELRRSLANEGLLGGFGGIGGGSVGGATYTFNQYNSSPKALDRLEIYRQTRNQLELAKGVS